MIANEFTEFYNFVKLGKERHKPNVRFNYPCIELEHIDKETGILLGSTESLHTVSIKNHFQSGDTLFGKLRPNLRKFLRPNFDGVCSTEIWVFKADVSKCDKVFLFYLVQSTKFIQAACKTTGSKMPRADWELLSLQPFYLPFFPEQQKIASILRTWDKAIWELKKLYEAKEKKYKAIAQNIFKNQATNEKWLPTSLSSISNIKKGKQLNRLDMKGGIYPAWNGGITPSGFTNEWNAEADTITISGGGNSCGFINLCKEKFWLGGSCYAITDLSTNINKYFLYFQLKKNELKIMKLRVGTGLPSIQKEPIHNYTVYIPPIDKQNKIANLLGSLCSELEIYKKQISIIKNQKQGLMQKLLTGQWRVKVDEEVR
ncbi:restriction endonuclease subunit S [Rickettsia endosymbiont of Orchestes rusci]|uniref:restriction endonuclease subunit S n=1 Tax=Rickettsia endosymbiont of Orchestes rusci TaxID=3066250 RepID=UPI00313D3F89